MKYTQFRQEQEKRYNEFPFIFAFSDKQMKEGMKRFGVKDVSELYSLGGGGFIRKKDSKEFHELINSFDKEREEFLKDDEQLLDALEYELGNHEYCITYNHEPALEALGLTFNELTDEQKEILNKAKEQHLESVDA